MPEPVKDKDVGEDIVVWYIGSTHSVGMYNAEIERLFGCTPVDGARLIAGAKVWVVNGTLDLGRMRCLTEAEHYQIMLGGPGPGQS